MKTQIIALSLLAATTFPVLAQSAGLEAVKTEEGIRIREGTADVLFYQRRTKSLAGKYARANYVHPLYDLDGNVLTEDFPEDHRHHRGIFWAWHQLWVGDRKIGDPWTTRDFVWDVQQATTTTHRDGSLSIAAHVQWKSPKWKTPKGELQPLVKERMRIRVYPAQTDARAIDFTIQLRALHDDMMIGGSEDVKGYGGFSPRIRLPEDVRFLGEKGEMTPLRTSVKAGRWLDIVGTFNEGGKQSGLAILCHPTLPVFPPPWILRAKRSMQNAVYPGDKPVPFPKEKPLVLRYRLVVHRGIPARDVLQMWQSCYESSPVQMLAE